MPELPEVEYACRQLRPAMEGARIERVIARRPQLRYPLPANFTAHLEGQRVLAVRRRAKYLLVDLASGDVLLMHLGMSGSFRVLRHKRRQVAHALREHALVTHDHVVFEMSSGHAVVFNDPRRFGFMKLLAGGGPAGDRTLAALGPEPLDRGFTAAALAHALRRRKTTLKAALSDQRVVAGLGNIYVVEALHRAGLSPKRKVSTLLTRSGEPRPQLEALVAAIVEVLKNAIANGHHTGNPDRFRVYDREGERCRRRGCTGVITRIEQAGRSSYFCPVCQR